MDRTDLKYLSFIEVDAEGRKTKIWTVYGRGMAMLLGYVKFRPQWRCYVFHPENNTLYDYKCMTDLRDFIEVQNRAWRAAL